MSSVRSRSPRKTLIRADGDDDIGYIGHGFQKMSLSSSRPLLWGLFLFILAASTAFAGGSSAFSLDWKKEAGLGFAGIGTFAFGHYAAERIEGSPAALGWFDEGIVFPFNGAIDKAGDLGCVAGLAALPFLLDGSDLENVSTVGVMYLESFLLANGLKDLLKSAVRRPRPTSFRLDGDGYDSLDSDDLASFPSGHATLAFMTAAFSSYVFSLGDTSPASKTAMTLASFTLAGATSLSRVFSGSHYAADIVAGALLGSAIGFVIPWIHAKGEGMPVSGIRIGEGGSGMVGGSGATIVLRLPL